MRGLLSALVFVFCVLSGAEANALAAVEITGMSDMTTTPWGIGDPAPSMHIDVCIYASGTSPSSGYAITATGSSGYNLVSGSNMLPYSVNWEDSGSGNLGASNGTQTTNGAKLTGQINANTLSATCALGLAGMNARLHVNITQAAMTAALAGTYQGTLTLVVSPN